MFETPDEERAQIVQTEASAARNLGDEPRPDKTTDESLVATERPVHRCQLPTVSGMTSPLQPDWMCAACERIWRDSRGPHGLQWWAEVRGPCRTPRGETL